MHKICEYTFPIQHVPGTRIVEYDTTNENNTILPNR